MVQECSSSFHHHGDRGAGEMDCGQSERMLVGSVGCSASVEPVPKALIDLGMGQYQSSEKRVCEHPI